MLLRLDQALGRIDERLPAQKARGELAARESFEYPSTDRTFLQQALRRLLDLLCERLAEHGLGVLRLECALVCPPGEPVVISVGLFQASASLGHLFGLVEMQLERKTLAEPVVAIEIEVPAHTRLERRQQELFSDVPPERHARHLAALVDRLANRLGRRAVGRPRLVPDAQPELAYTYDPLIEEETRGRKRAVLFKRGLSPFSPGSEKLPPRPLRLFRRPTQLEVISVPPHGPPIQLRLRGRRHEIAASWGPERIETGWWRNRPVGRDYYRIETAEGQRYWIFRRLSDGRWFAHGSFE
jgi:protein ImuB